MWIGLRPDPDPVLTLVRAIVDEKWWMGKRATYAAGVPVYTRGIRIRIPSGKTLQRRRLCNDAIHESRFKLLAALVSK